MKVPPWLTVLVAAVVIGFGVYRIYLSRRSDEAEARALQSKGLYARPRRTHLLFGIVYLLLGALLVASLFGFNPLKTGSGAPDPAPAAPAGTTGVEVR